MNPYNAYRQNQIQSEGSTRIDLLLALYDGAIDRLTRARAAFRNGDRPGALSHIARTQLIVMELAAGVRVEVDEAMGTNMLRLYEYVGHRLSQGGSGAIDDAVSVLTTLRDGFRTVRPEAVELERTGQIPAANDLAVFATQA